MHLTSTPLSLEIVRPITEHAQLIMEWRNDPQTLAMSFHQEPKKWEEFYSEFLEYYFSFPELPPLFIVQKGEKIAFLRFTYAIHPKNPSVKCCEISINLAPQWRGKGFGKKILTEIQSWIKQQGFGAIYAEVKLANLTSKKIFLETGFTLLEDGVKAVFSTGEQVPIHRFLIELAPSNCSHHVFVVAEAGSNWRMGTWGRDLAMAKQLIEIAAESGADAVKFQVFRSESVYVANAGQSNYLASAGIQEDISTLFADLAMPYEMIPELKLYCQQCKIEFMATPFSPQDFYAVDPYVNIHKVASYEIGYPDLLKLMGESKKPIFMSTGAATEEEIAWAMALLKSYQSQVTLLQCTAHYPAVEKSMHLNTLNWLKGRFHVEVGLSDHSLDPCCAPIAAVALGAKVIEKHFTLDKRLPGPDHAFALTPQELKQMVRSIRQTSQMLGSPMKCIDPSEHELRSYASRGIQAIADINEGETFKSGKNIGVLRPGKQQKGLHAQYLQRLEGKIAKRNITRGSGIEYGDL